MFFLSEKPSKFLMNLCNQKGSALEIGRQTYGCNNSIYQTIDKFVEMGLIEVSKKSRDLHIKMTKKGVEVVESISKLSFF